MTAADRLAAGDYVLAVTAYDGAGNSLASAEKQVVIPERPAWFGSKAGVTEAVLPPYTPVQVAEEPGALTLGVWGREYRLGSHPLPEQIVSAQAALLDGPMRLRAVVDGREVAWPEAVPTIHRRTPAQATLTQTASAGELTLQCVSRIEYDGLLKTECILKSRVPARVQSLVLEIPVKKEHARYFYTWPTVYGGTGFSGHSAERWSSASIRSSGSATRPAGCRGSVNRSRTGRRTIRPGRFGWFPPTSERRCKFI